MSTSIPEPLRGPARAVRDAVREATSGPRGRWSSARRHDRVTAPAPEVLRHPGSRLRVSVHASERVRSGLAGQWELTDRDPQAVLVEVDARSALSAEAPFAQQRTAVAGAAAPVIVWVTSSTRTGAGVDVVRRLLEDVAVPIHVLVDDEASRPDWAERLGRDVGHAGPAVDTLVHSPATTGALTHREQALALVGDPGFDVGRLAPLPADRLDVIGGEGAADEIPGDRPVLGRYRATAFVRDRPQSPWQVLEAAAAGSAVLATDPTLERVPPQLAQRLTRVEGDTGLRLQAAAHLWQDELVDRAAHAAARAARAGHSFADRTAGLEALLGHHPPGRRGPAGPRGVSAVVSTNRAHELDTVADNLARQQELVDGNVQVVLVLHGLAVPETEVTARFADRGVDRLVVRHADASLTLGRCLGLGIEASDGEHVAKIDDDNFYGRYYLTDLVDALDFSGAGIVGKWAHYTWLRASGAVVLRAPRSEHRFERLVQGGSILMSGDVARGVGFADLPRGVDTDLLDRARAQGVRTYSADRFGYVSIRGADRHAHTWTIEDASLMNRSSRVVFYGDPREHVDV